MAWYAKPSGPYAPRTPEGTGNIREINDILSGEGYTTEAISGVIGNMIAESGLNPWRWQSDAVNYAAGYGLFQYTPASSYFEKCSGLAAYAPNLSVTGVTEGAKPTDGIAQVIGFVDNLLGKWIRGCWRSYWDPQDYPDYYALRKTVLNAYGDGNNLTQKQFSKINNIRDATFSFLACFEGPAVPHLEQREVNAVIAYEIITGHEPPTPPPRPVSQRHLPIWMMIRYKK